MAVGAEAFREARPAPQASQRAEYLDLRSHGAAQIQATARLPAERSRSAVPGNASGQSIPAPPHRGRKARKFSRR